MVAHKGKVATLVHSLVWMKAVLVECETLWRQRGTIAGISRASLAMMSRSTQRDDLELA